MHACMLFACVVCMCAPMRVSLPIFFSILSLHDVMLCFTGRSDQAVDKVSPVSVSMNSRRNRKPMLHCGGCWLYNVGAILFIGFLPDLAHVPKFVSFCGISPWIAAKIRHSTGKVKAKTG